MDTFIRSFSAAPKHFYGWRFVSFGDVSCCVAGELSSLDKIVSLLSSPTPNFSGISSLLVNEKSVFACVISSPDFVFASVDRIKSFPIFYGVDANQKLFVSNCPYSIKSDAKLSEVDDSAMLNFSMMGYTLGNRTLYHSLFQLQAGEFLFFHTSQPSLSVNRFYRYLPAEDFSASFDDLLQEQRVIMDNVIDRVIDKANGRTICLTLSGGLDSRILLTKLVEKKYDRLKVFSYGLRGNFEAQMAKHVAETLNIPWQFIPSQPHLAKKLYQSDERLQYGKFISALHTVPTYLEYEALQHLTHHRLIPEDSLMLNGQSGDFITGGHLPKLIMENDQPNFNHFVDAAMKKHGSLWLQLVKPENIDALRQDIMRWLPPADYNSLSKADLLSRYESWEWQERQCKAVIQGQRLYDFFHYDWALPLWDPELMDFWAKVPFEWKHNQKLYIAYLQTDYPKLFNTIRPVAQPWVARFRWIPLVAKLYGLCFGASKKQDFYKRMYYYSTDHNQYALIDRKYYLSHYKRARGVVSFIVSLCLDELGILDKSQIADTKPS